MDIIRIFVGDRLAFEGHQVRDIGYPTAEDPYWTIQVARWIRRNGSRLSVGRKPIPNRRCEMGIGWFGGWLVGLFVAMVIGVLVAPQPAIVNLLLGFVCSMVGGMVGQMLCRQ